MPNRRLPAAAAFFAAALTAFAVLLWGLQVTSGAAYYAKSQRSIAQVETVPAARGKLLDRNGTILAQDQVTWSAVLAEDVEDQVVRRLKTLCQEEDVAWEGTGPIAGVTPRLLARVKEEGLAGVSFTPAVQRVGSGTLAPHVLGRVGQMSPEEWEVYQDRGYAMDETVGKDGAEGAFESYLHGTPGQKVLETDKDGRITGETNAVQPQAGRDVTLTLDRDLQAAAETALAGFLDRHPQATGGALVALDVRDGGVLAMVSQPGYDAASFSADYAALSQDEAHPLMNRAVQGLYAPGSTFKLVTAAAALEEGFLTPETQILDTGRYTYYKSPQPQCWLYRQEGKPAVKAAASFTDVAENMWYADAVAWAAENGIVYGVTEDKFDPNGNLTREQIAAILYRYAGFKGRDTAARADLTAFPDADSVSSYAKDAMSWAVAENILAGSKTNDGTTYLQPRNTATREQVAQLMMQYIEADK